MVQRITAIQRDRMRKLATRAKDNEGYSESLAAAGVRFTGRPTAAGDRELIEEAKLMTEPDWASLKLDQLVAAERMARHRLSGGEARWQGILERIRAALKKVR